MTARTITFVSHTHWDREWYQPFEEYRIRLVQLVDKLLQILHTDPEYRYYMLDGQTIVLEDYLAIRPEREGEIRALVACGRLLIGPWYVLPDEFLVSPESLIRNLITGARTAARFGRRMDVGNIPDPFGHISQLPQVLRGFDIDSAVFSRGVGQAPNEFRWAAPDGSDVLVIYQHSGYGNAANMPSGPEAFIARTQAIVEELGATATTCHLLAMNGTDHLEPQPELPRLLAMANAGLPDVDVRHGTLPQFIAAVRAEDPALETRTGEMRDPSRMPLLPGVLSARMWIKQRNAACEGLLTGWAEPLAAIAEMTEVPLALHDQSALINQAWRYLLQNHPHDSICGCSIDQVHREMDVRFDWVEQIAENVTARCLQGIAGAINTSSDDGASAVVVFNPTTWARSDWVSVAVPIPDGQEAVVLVSGDQVIDGHLTDRRLDVLWDTEIPGDQLTPMIRWGIPEEIDGYAVQELQVGMEGAACSIAVRVEQGMPPNRDLLEHARAEVLQLLDDGEVATVRLLVHKGTLAVCSFVARDVPGLGYRTYRVRPTVKGAKEWLAEPTEPAMENEYLRVWVAKDGTCSLLDKRTGDVYDGLNRFVDGGDRGDEYNFCPVEKDTLIEVSGADPLVCLVESSPARQTLEVSMTYEVPASLDETRRGRSEEHVELAITTRLSLIPGVPRLEIETTVDNCAADHRLRVHFPVPASVDVFHTEGHFDVAARSLDLPQDTETWVEQPSATHPQRTWADVSDERVGLMVANRGLPEVEVLRAEHGSEIALTLLRCVGWLSRGDLSVRRGHAGPGLATPSAQCIGEHTFQYGLIPHRGDWKDGFDSACAFAQPLRAVATSAHAGTLPSRGGWIELRPRTLVISAVKKAASGEGLIVRFWNVQNQPCSGTVKLWRRPTRVVRCNLGERELEPLTVDSRDEVQLSVGGREAMTLMVQFEVESRG